MSTNMSNSTRQSQKRKKRNLKIPPLVGALLAGAAFIILMLLSIEIVMIIKALAEGLKRTLDLFKNPEMLMLLYCIMLGAGIQCSLKNRENELPPQQKNNPSELE